VRSVTIIAPDGLTSEGLSKSLFVLGVQKGMRLIEAQPGVDAVVVDSAGVLHYSAGLRPAAPAPDATQKPATPTQAATRLPAQEKAPLQVQSQVQLPSTTETSPQKVTV
jgi:hypothetical protein